MSQKNLEEFNIADATLLDTIDLTLRKTLRKIKRQHKLKKVNNFASLIIQTKKRGKNAQL